MSDESRPLRGSRRFGALLGLSAVGVALLAWRFLDDFRPWWAFGAAVLAAIAGVALGAKGPRRSDRGEKRT